MATDDDPAPDGDSFVAAVFHDVDHFRDALRGLLAAGVDPARISVLGEHDAVRDHFGGVVPEAEELADRLDAPREPLDDELAVERAIRLIGEGLSIIGTIGAAGLAYAIGGPVGVAVGTGTATETKVDDVLLGYVGRTYTERFEESVRDGGIVCWVHARDGREADRVGRTLSANSGTAVHRVETGGTGR